jgi:hypothetical protein
MLTHLPKIHRVLENYSHKRKIIFQKYTGNLKITFITFLKYIRRHRKLGRIVPDADALATMLSDQEFAKDLSSRLAVHERSRNRPARHAISPARGKSRYGEAPMTDNPRRIHRGPKSTVAVRSSTTAPRSCRFGPVSVLFV